MSDDSDRTEGVNVGDLEPVLEALSYPVTAEEIVAEHGDRELQRTNAEPVTLAELLGPMGETEFESPKDLETMVIGQMPEETTGRENYSDRGGSQPTGTEDAEDVGDQ